MNTSIDSDVQRTILVLTIFVSLIPLFVTPVLPLTDFYAHIARYYVLANLPDSKSLQQHYEAAWHLLPNLGLDIVGVSIMKVLHPLLGAKLIAGLIIAAPFVGVLYLSHVLHGRIAILNVLLAGLVAYNHILIWGFSNFLLGLGVLLGATGYWIATQDRPTRQLLVTSVLGLLLFFIHGFAFALWGLILGMVELSLALRAGYPGFATLARRASRLALIAIAPALLFLQTKTAGGGAASPVSNLLAHAEKGTLWSRLSTEIFWRIDGFLRVADSTWRSFDYVFGIVLWGMLICGLLTGVWRIEKRMKLAVSLCTVLVLIIPPNLFGVGHLSERTPLLLLTLLAAGLSLNPGAKPSYRQAAVATLAGLLLVRNLVLTTGWYQDGRNYAAFLDALDNHDTLSLGAGAYLEETRDPQIFRPSCIPLSFLMVFNGTAVPTFSNPTQQPIRLLGSLSDIQLATRQISRGSDYTVSSALAVLSQAKADTVVICAVDSFRQQVDGFSILAAAEPWTLYQRIASQ
ncbi:hypothetical protein [Ruegeria arenilitoris]|uniref:hypothetical protein n=1 Tax=Ruegeria arenilitoris TaxID=1173585 RepID=UPI00147FA39A|nr:hypothetical protein [Ruegeria arenilitoris]